MEGSAVLKYLDPKTLPFPFCPGCGHGFILPRIDEALERIQADPARVVIVTDIGCVGLSDQYFRTHAFHGLHGRSVTYATGIKLADPDLHVLVLMGDGGMGIGGAHLLSAARRNIGITVLVFNNENFGMTGGQHSVTTPENARTPTTRMGNLETPLDIYATLSPSKPNFLARSHAYDPALSGLIAEGLTCGGFALIDIQEYCTAYFVPANMTEENGILALPVEETPVVAVSRHDREEYSRAYRSRYHRPPGTPEKERKETSLDPVFSHRLTRKTSVVLAGGAGQKIQSTAALLCRAAILSGLHATQKNDYPITIMTGYSVSEILVSPEPIDYTGIVSPDILVLLSEEGLKKVGKSIPALSATSILYAEESLTLPPTRASVRRLPFRQTAAKIDSASVALVAVGALLSNSGAIPAEAVKQVLREIADLDRASKSLAAFDAGYAMRRQTSGTAGG
ncbi:MAG: 2-oxoacid:acceptor oxidoreductase family protein [Nitrospirae bacterium]|nr:2-oxoacid:acceptor oxidoreductase family protein [Nitrospirota bacterium]